MKKKIYIGIGIAIFIGLVAEAWHWLNQLPEVRLALVDEDKKPTPVTNDWRVALLETVKLTPKEGIKQSVEIHFERFDLNRISGEVSPVAEATARFNWPLDLLKPPENAPASADHLRIKHLPEQLTYWQVRGTKKIIIPVAVMGRYGLAAGFLAIKLPEKTIAGVRFYHSEDSPELGQSVLLPDFGERFIGKQLFDDRNRFALKIVQPAKTGQKNHHDGFTVDGISGATITSSGIEKAFKFWTGKDAYGSLL